MGLGLALSLWIAGGDARFANAGREAARDLHARYHRKGTVIWFIEHWGFQYYAEKLGLIPMDRWHSELKPGQLLIWHETNSDSLILGTRMEKLELVDEHFYGDGGWMHTVSVARGACFYSDRMGHLPWTVGAEPPERYIVYRVTEPIAPRPP